MYSQRWTRFLNLTLLTSLVTNVPSIYSFEVIYAINAGGEGHTDSYGIRYMKDPLMGKVGTASDYGKQLIIGRVNNIDQILYQTERYHHSTFGYDIPITEDGDYVMILKFCEVYFNSPNMKVFDVVLNGNHTVVTDLDIFEKVGRGIAHDEYVAFKVEKGKLIYNEEESDILGGKIRVEFIKGYRDNPKINAIAVIMGKIEDVPKLGPIPQEPEKMYSQRWTRFLNLTLLTSLVTNVPSIYSFEVIYAINAGGEGHTDSYGIRYMKDPLMGKVGTASDYGKQLIIGRVNNIDQILYQTERYHHSTFGYDIPITEDGDYVMILKFCEVYFNSPNMKVFDVVLNGNHTVVTDLDIFEKVGRGIAHDEYVAFKVEKGKLIYNEEESDILGGKIRVEFIKGYRDNPKINAIAVIMGKIEDVPKLGPIPQEPEKMYSQRWTRFLNLTLLTSLVTNVPSIYSFEVIYAINAGGEGHTDSYGIRYMKDPLMGKVGTASDYGKQLIIGRVNNIDQILYQTERYHHSTFGYDIPITEDGDYVMILKFCEVYFNSPNMKVFDVVLNGNHTVVTDLDIFEKVGRGIAHDEYVAFKVEKGKLIYNEEESDILGGKIRVEFIKGYRDNPKINAIAVIMGKIEDVPKLGPIPQEPEKMYSQRWTRFLNLTLLTSLVTNVPSIYSFEVIYAINAGGEGHTDSYGIRYMKDPLMGKVGTASDYGKQLIIGRVNNIDQILYQTERYHHSTFGYDIPITEDGDYVMILKFCEVYFNSPNMKVFDVVLNGNHTVVTDLDIFEKVGRGIAHDEYVAFKVEKGKLIYNEEESDILGGKIRVEFIKGYRDNPKINAIAVIMGKIEDVPKLGPIPQEPEEYHGIQDDEHKHP